tara:strand:- start:1820 stop:4057 length:2238 start_codon:yes stop_codon:yes gene_type:complete
MAHYGTHNDNMSMTPASIDASGKKIFNTLSCPCSSKAIKLDDDRIVCEANNFGDIITLNAIPIQNHLIGGSRPRIKDKWRCTGIKCNEGDFKWDSLYIVDIKEEIDTGKTSLFNSKVSTSNCYIPNFDLGIKTSSNEITWTDKDLAQYSDLLTSYGFDGSADINIEDNLGTVNGLPVFETEKQAWHYSNLKKVRGPLGISAVEYLSEDISGFIPGGHTGEEKLITRVVLNGKSILNVKEDFREKDPNAHSAYNPTVSAIGGVIDIKITGVNKPTFDLSIKDSSGSCVLKEKVKNKSSNNYTLQHIVPALLPGKTIETYKVELLPVGESLYDVPALGPTAGTLKANIYQYAISNYTIQSATSTLSGFTTTTTPKIISGEAISHVTSYSKQTTDLPLEHTVTLTRSSGTSLLYVTKTPKVEDVITDSSFIYKDVIREDKDNSPVKELLIRGSSSSSDGTSITKTGDIAVGMKTKFTVTKTKEIVSFIDLETKEPCEKDRVDVYTNKFNIVNSPNDIFEDMIVTGVDADNNNFTTSLVHIENSEGGFSCITLGKKYILDKNTILTFTYRHRANVVGVKQSRSGQLVRISSPCRVEHGQTVEFRSGNESYIEGIIKHTATGASSITITTIINDVKFGREDQTFTLNVDDFVSVKPQAKDQKITVGKDSNIYIDFAKGVNSKDVRSLTTAITSDSKRGLLTSLVKDAEVDHLSGRRYTPGDGFTGKDKIKFTLSDGVNTSDEKTIFITVK